MLTGQFDNSNLASVVVLRLPRSLAMSSLSVSLLQPTESVERGTSPGMEWPADAVVEGRAFKGACWALAIEGVSAICIYGLWHLWSLTR